ncbi:uncharacterized protein LOC116161296 [Photinus pyralis]|uniref:uncharacterized protein LOC116161296 n=1 Tax=Photinus pyralis TaxID=7054 RepID=UPI0012676941|nr:uncharacterized protein LOC116161296 [Photinus pyralis]
MYAVVKFINEEESYSEIPSAWIAEDKSFCYWPNQKNCGQLMIKNVLPEQNWKKEPINIEGLYDTLEKARRVAQDPDYTSQEEESRIRHKPKRWVDLEGSDEDSCDDFDKPPQLPKKYNKGNKNTRPVTSASVVKDQQQSSIVGCYEIIDGILTNINNNIEVTPAIAKQVVSLPLDGKNVTHQTLDVEDDKIEEEHSTEASAEADDFELLTAQLEKVYKLQVENNHYLKAIMTKLNKIELTSSNKTKSLKTQEAIIENLPFTDTTKWIDFEQNLSGKAKEALTAYIEKIGGRNVKDSIHRCLRAVYSNEMAKHCSWLGQRGNFKIKGTITMGIIKAIIGEHYHTITDADFEAVVSEWFRLASTRLKMKKLRDEI